MPAKRVYQSRLSFLPSSETSVYVLARDHWSHCLKMRFRLEGGYFSLGETNREVILFLILK